MEARSTVNLVTVAETCRGDCTEARSTNLVTLQKLAEETTRMHGHSSNWRPLHELAENLQRGWGDYTDSWSTVNQVIATEQFAGGIAWRHRHAWLLGGGGQR